MKKIKSKTYLRGCLWYLIGSLFIIVNFIRCEEEKISEDKMVDILTHISIVDNMINISNKKDSIEKVQYIEGVFKNANITKEEFIDAYNIYAKDPKKISIINKKVLAKLKNMDSTKTKPKK